MAIKYGDTEMMKLSNTTTHAVVVVAAGFFSMMASTVSVKGESYTFIGTSRNGRHVPICTADIHIIPLGYTVVSYNEFMDDYEILQDDIQEEIE